MPHALPRKIKLAFIVQALVASVAIALLIMISALLVRRVIVEQTARREAAAFWSAYQTDPVSALPHGIAVSSYFVPVGGDLVALPPSLRGLSVGLHRVLELPGRMAYVDERARGRFVLVFDTSLIDTAILWISLGSTLLALVTSYVMSWWAYHTTKRLVVPVSWLADVVMRWDPRAPDTEVIRAHNLPPDSGREVQQLTGALTDLADRVTAFVQRERNFTRDASHELRTPLTVIRVAADLMLADPEASSRQLRSLTRMQRAGRDMEAVIDAFLILAREAEIEPLSEEFDVREIIAHEVERVQPMLVGRPIELAVIDEGAPTLFAPPHVLAVMVGNLLGNAVRFTDKGRIELYLASDRIEVRDTGIGMTEETMVKAFDPFYRADPAREEGRGMGLSIVRRLGERFGWPVSLRSAPGEGTRATILFRPAS
jgi:signal transduction histidine kinase